MRFSTEAVPLLTTRERLRALESFFLVVRVFGRSTVLLNFRVVKGASQRKHLKEMSSLTGLQIMGKIEGRKRRERQGTRWLDGITDSMDIQ